ncbi:MFS transporter [Pandoraea pnomenusa]|uniref:MFS transporter n=1 Tax=Pandoraea pnomenusa TaxID=93220 RepID=UPI0033420C7E
MRVDITALKEVQRINAFHFRVMALCALLLFLDGFDLMAMGFVARDIAMELALSPQQLGLAFSAGVLGMCIGAVAFGVLGDRWGRRPSTIVACLVFGIGTLLTAWASHLDTLLLWRFIAGIGLGGGTPLALSLAADYSPKRIRGTVSMVLYCGYTVGCLSGGAVNTVLAGSGWQALFYVGGVFTLAFVPVLIVWLPESLEQLVKSGKGAAAGKILERIRPDFIARSTDVYECESASESGVRGKVAELFRHGAGVKTLLLWAAFFSGLLSLYFYGNWLPTMLRQMGFSQQQAVAGSIVGQFGNLFLSLVMAKLIGKVPVSRVIGITYILSGGLMLSVSIVGSDYPSQLAVNALAFGLLAGSLGGLYALAPAIYAPSVRATGTGWAMGVGRVGAVLGPSIAGVLMSNQWTAIEVLKLAAVPTALAGVFCLLIELTSKAPVASGVATGELS